MITADNDNYHRLYDQAHEITQGLLPTTPPPSSVINYTINGYFNTHCAISFTRA